jgi:hypothetical protein
LDGVGENFNLILKKVDQLGVKMGQVCQVIENHTHSILQKLLRSIQTHFECSVCYLIPVDDKVLVTTCCHHVMCSVCHSKCKESNKNCPLCRSSSAYLAPINLNGSTELMRELRKLPR